MISRLNFKIIVTPDQLTIYILDKEKTTYVCVVYPRPIPSLLEYTEIDRFCRNHSYSKVDFKRRHNKL